MSARLSTSFELPRACFFFLMIRLPPTSTLFPYTTLFRSQVEFTIQPFECRPHIVDFTYAVIMLPLRSEEHTSELQSRPHLVCSLLLEKKKKDAIPAWSSRNGRVKSRMVKRDTAPATRITVTHSKVPFSFFFNDTATTEIYTLSLHDALPISSDSATRPSASTIRPCSCERRCRRRSEEHTSELQSRPHLVCRLLLENKNTSNFELKDPEKGNNNPTMTIRNGLD